MRPKTIRARLRVITIGVVMLPLATLLVVLLGADRIRLEAWEWSALAAALVVGLTFAFVTGRSIATPLEEVLRTARKVSQQHGYSARAKKFGGGEFGDLTDAFNRMLEQIESRDRIVTDAKESAEAAARAKSDFLATMSHEIRTPLNAIHGLAQVLKKAETDERKQRDLETLEKSALELNQLLSDLLDFSKLEAGRVDLEQREFNLRETAELVAELMAPRAEAKSIEIVVSIPHDFPVHLRGDETRLRQVITNLASNAVKFTARGEVLLRAELIEVVERGVRFRFVVQDTGIGLDEAARSRLFAPFTQADSSTTRCFGGTGLGLAICKELVHVMQGSIGVDSEPGVGSEFWFELLLRPTSELRVQSEDVPESIAGRRIVVVERNASAGRALRDHLESWGAHVEEATSNERAIEILQQTALNDTHDLVIAASTLASGDAEDLVSRMRGATRLSAIPVLVATYNEGRRELADIRGVAGILSKPLRRGQLLSALGQVFEGNGQYVREIAAIDSQHFDPTNRKILVADDNPINQRVLGRMLEKLGCEVVTVNNGQEAVDRIQAERDFALVLMDCQMPVLDGYEATRAIRRDEGSGRHLPIIAVTANAMRGDKERCLVAGMDDYVTKPIRFEQLESVMENWLSRQPT